MQFEVLFKDMDYSVGLSSDAIMLPNEYPAFVLDKFWRQRNRQNPMFETLED